MGAHARRQCMPAARAAVAAALAVVIVTAIVGFGATDEAPAASPVAVPALALPVEAPEPADSVSADPGLAPQARDAQTQASEPVAAPPSDGSAPEPAPEGSAPLTQPLPSVPVAADPPATAAPALVMGTPCTATARACVDLDGRQAWLIDDGTVVRGPVTIMSGSLDDPTPVGTFTVQWKAEEYTSREYLVQMPYSVFFADGGIAFHEGRQDTYSAGCVKLVHDDAVEWFRFLQVGDEVQVR